MDAEISPDPTEPERRAILAALGPVPVPAPYSSPWRAAALEELGGDPAAQELWGDARIVEP
jgi:hypothetical protein